MTLEQHFHDQHLANGYALVNGVRAARPVRRPLRDRQSVVSQARRRRATSSKCASTRHASLPILMPRPTVSVHTAKSRRPNRSCATSNRPSLRPISPQPVPSRGWGEQFWVKIVEREGQYLAGEIDNPLYEARLHGLNLGDTIYFHEDHILIVHSSHGREIVSRMGEPYCGFFPATRSCRYRKRTFECTIARACP